jgi:phosphoribosyl 1,2-cyclic phosphate phosphodiesterase
MKVIVLGSGTSHGVPIIGCNCPTCTSTNPKDKRLRVSVYIVSDPDPISGKTERLLIDTSPDFRQQMLVNRLSDIDAVLYTHHHIDHIMGLDDIFIINLLQKKTIEIYGNEETILQIKVTFRYIFDDKTFKGGGIPDIHCNIIGLEKFSIGHVEITPIKYFHGSAIVYGYRIGGFAYITDCSRIPEKEFPKLEGLKVLIIDALRYKPHPTHFSIDQAIEVSRRINAEQTYFTHLTHDVLHDKANSMLPVNIQLAYDGLTVEI